jgi:methylated-DNA-protein-cysteine methyltransferase-like protein
MHALAAEMLSVGTDVFICPICAGTDALVCPTLRFAPFAANSYNSQVASHKEIQMRERIVAAIRKVPRGHVSSYGAIAKAAGFPGAARQVAWTLHSSAGLPWHRIVGAGGEIKLRGESAFEQRFRLESEGVTFRGRRVNMRAHEFKFTTPKRKRVSKNFAKSRRKLKGKT